MGENSRQIRGSISYIQHLSLVSERFRKRTRWEHFKGSRNKADSEYNSAHSVLSRSGPLWQTCGQCGKKWALNYPCVKRLFFCSRSLHTLLIPLNFGAILLSFCSCSNGFAASTRTPSWGRRRPAFASRKILQCKFGFASLGPSGS